MSRSGYSDDCENVGLWRGAVEKALKGKRGQSFLKELADAMDAMPEKRLIESDLIDAQGECCTIGTVCKFRNIDTSEVDALEPESVGEAVGISRAMAAEIEYLNDEWGPHDETPEERWTRMRQWVDEQIIKESEKSE
jgi:hypothetical protein